VADTVIVPETEEPAAGLVIDTVGEEFDELNMEMG